MGNCCEGPTSTKVQHLNAERTTTFPKTQEQDSTNDGTEKLSVSASVQRDQYHQQIAAANEASAKQKATQWTDDGDDDWVDDVPQSFKLSAVKLAKRRPALSAEAYGLWNKPVQHQPQLHPKSEDQARQIRQGLRNSPFFAAMPEEDLIIAINASRPRSFEKGFEVVTEGDPHGDEFYILGAGSLHAFKRVGASQGHPGQKLFTFNQAGQSFGELALLYNCPRAATIITAEPCLLYSLDRDTFKMVLRDNAIARRERNIGFLRSVKLLEPLDIVEIGQIADALRSETFKRGDFVVRVGEMGDSFYIVEEGEAVARINGMDARSYTRGGYFGELSLINDRPRAADIVASSEQLKVVSLDRDSFKRLLGQNALFKQLEETVVTQTNGATGAKKKGVGFAHSDDNDDKQTSTVRRGTGYIQKGQVDKLLQEQNGVDSSLELGGVRFDVEVGSDDGKPSSNPTRRGTGFIQEDQLQKLLKDMNNGEDYDELGGGSGVKFDIDPSVADKTGTARRGTGFIQQDQLKKLTEGAEDGDHVQFEGEDDSPNKKAVTRRGTGYVQKAQLDKYTDEDDPEDSVTASDMVNGKEKGAAKKSCCTIS
eukprot:gnl/MRDRNA2_/MRDRNA2_57684_c0_seq1.p1 gnl/MRDRNA2_/MRDRNA2_57684_c0~~gnl/MRDRNA2_/MRDRNA2_57684_c0_seq1.p1  ORF type:complete len:595 (+),score=137.32 gnl/MRDRNA2_/MRDRNA2_57684_c0_seq1:165-1949(+)